MSEILKKELELMKLLQKLKKEKDKIPKKVK